MLRSFRILGALRTTRPSRTRYSTQQEPKPDASATPNQAASASPMGNFDIGAGARGAFHDPAAGPNSRPAMADGEAAEVKENSGTPNGTAGATNGSGAGTEEPDPAREGVRDPVRGPSSSPKEAKAALRKEPKVEEESAPQPEPVSPLVTASPRHRHPFDTHSFVTRLEKAEISPQGARTLMEGVRNLIVGRSEWARSRMLSTEEMDNAAYRFKAALSELRTEQSVRSRNDGIVLRSALSAIRREVDGLEQNMKADLQGLRHDLDLDLNNRKTDTRSDMKRFDIAVEEINNKFTISLGDLRTEIESAKWEATRRAISIIAMLVIGGIALSTISISGATKPAAPTPPVMRDVGVGTEDYAHEDEHLGDHDRVSEQLDALLDRGWREREKERERERKAAESDVPGGFSERI